MRLLYLALDCPLPANNGMRMRTWAVLRALRAEGCRVELVCQQSASDAPVESELRTVCDSIWLLDHRAASLTQGGDWARRFMAAGSRLPYAALRFRAPSVESLVRQLAGWGELDAIVCDTIFAAVNVPEGLAPLVVNHHNIEHRIFESFAGVTRNPLHREAARWEGRKVNAWECAVGRRTAVNWVCSPADRDRLLDQQPRATVVVAPNIVDSAVDASADAADPAGEDADTVLFQGALDWFPNRDAVEYLLAAIWPLILRDYPRARLIIAGRNPPPAFLARHRDDPGVTFTGTVPDMRPWLRRAAVCVAPLRIGSGTRLKILEAAAMGKAMVATPLGAEGLAFTPGTEILLAAAPERFAAAAVRLLRDSNFRHELGAGARERVRADYGFAALRRAVGQGLAMLPTGARVGHAPDAVLRAAAAHS